MPIKGFIDFSPAPGEPIWIAAEHVAELRNKLDRDFHITFKFNHITIPIFTDDKDKIIEVYQLESQKETKVSQVKDKNTGPKMSVGHDGLSKICEVLGMEENPVKRVILDINGDGLVSVYTDQYIEDARFDELLGILVRSKPKTISRKSEPEVLEQPELT